MKMKKRHVNVQMAWLSDGADAVGSVHRLTNQRPVASGLAAVINRCGAAIGPRLFIAF